MKRYLILISLLFLCTGFAGTAYAGEPVHKNKYDVQAILAPAEGIMSYNLLYFAQTLLGTPYRPASADPLRGFDCSGFVSYVFKQFNFDVPRSSCEFINVGKKIMLGDARPGDIILFTGTKTHHPHSIGHIGIVYSNEGNGLRFIHSTSGKEYCVTISAMDDTYKRRFVQVIRLISQNDNL